MTQCKKTIIALAISVMLPLVGWSEVPVVDDSDNFAVMDEQQVAQAPVANSKYDDRRNEQYASDTQDERALANEDQSSDSNPGVNGNAKLIDKILALEKEVQELRGQLEVQAHDMKTLKDQQLAFYKDLDGRIANGSSKSAQSNAVAATPPPTEIGPKLDSKPSAAKPIKTSQATPPPVIPVSRANPADEQISYLAAYELVKNKRFDDAINAMQIFVQKYPNGGYTSNAQYWLGELYLTKEDYPKAIEHFEMVLDRFPSSSKSAASLLKAGYAYTASGDYDTAKARYQQLIKNYPGTPLAKLANEKLQQI